eukprot:scaffold80890_cov19-Tisochrysis_lutea.AAC.3
MPALTWSTGEQHGTRTGGPAAPRLVGVPEGNGTDLTLEMYRQEQDHAPVSAPPAGCAQHRGHLA